MVLPALSHPWAPSSTNAKRVLLLLFVIAALVVSSSAFLALWHIIEPYPPYPHLPHIPIRRPPRYPFSQHWLDAIPLTREINITQMLLDRPGKWDMFLQPIDELHDAPLPQTYQCADSPHFGPLVFIGVFSVAREWRQRSVIRALQTIGDPSGDRIVSKFILGQSADAELQKRAEAEAETYGDMVFLDVGENMDDGKTYAYFKWMAGMEEGERPRFTLKTDSDTFLVLPLVLHTLSHVSCDQLIYWGTSWGSSIHTHFPFYMRGLSYGLSWPLVAWLGSADLASWATRGFEDARTGAWFANLPGEAGPLTVVDLHYHMGDYDGTTIPWDRDTVALHGMKNPELWARVASRLREMWDKTGREWAWPPQGTQWSKLLWNIGM